MLGSPKGSLKFSLEHSLGYVFSFSKNALIDCDSLMSLVTLFQLLAAEKLNEFLAILVLTFGRIKLCFGPFVFLVLLRLLRCNIE